jgi:hypothetical protein
LPDFVGLSTGEYHVLEAKGRANFSSNVSDSVVTAARNKSLFQVCRVDRVNGKVPTIMAGCVFCFEKKKLTGLIVDPGPTEHMQLTLDKTSLLRSYYRFFLDDFFETHSEIGSDGFIGLEFASGWRIAIEKHALVSMRRLESPQSVDRL